MKYPPSWRWAKASAWLTALTACVNGMAALLQRAAAFCLRRAKRLSAGWTVSRARR